MDAVSAQRLRCKSFPYLHISIVLSYLLVPQWYELESTRVVLFVIGPSRVKARVLLLPCTDYNHTTLTLRPANS